MELHIEVAPETLWHLEIPGTGIALNITNSFITMLLVMAFLVIAGALIARSATLVPGRIQSVFEIVVEFILNLVESTAGKRFGRSIFPLIGGLFIFIIVSNYSGLLPGVGTIGIWHEEAAESAKLAAAAGASGESASEAHRVLVPLFRSPSADLNMTLAMALLSYVTFQFLGIRAHGVWGRLKHMANPPFLFPIEVISEFSRIVSLSFRLFGNIFAGEALLTVMYGIANAIKFSVVGLLIPVVFLYLEVLFGFIQALVFALLTLIYITLAAADSHAGHGEQHDLAQAPARAKASGD
ncbi:F0F1 ATP synthase subunit A [Thermomicrobiaceae bacterium CFH 74404]|uniref:ATP synthase subunit a n=3 Tax=Thermomicrobia TaxID=189775 RepID=A0AA41WFL1_9BACT|nr:F0F1 ATP synthase subunit A [Thermalbibacter longus]MCM8750173.1 F0F1 ATP synthase subunit A [Thermalbibacter longus]